MTGIIIRRRLMTTSGGVLGVFYFNPLEGGQIEIQYEVGMTWAEFCESSYNIVPGYGSFQISSAGTVNIDGYDVTDGSTGTVARGSDSITPSGEYGMEGGGSESEDTGTTKNLAIMGPDNVTGETVQLALIADGNAVDNNGAIWSVNTPETENTYASISQTGLVTILEDADSTSIVVTATYMGVSARKTIRITYQSGTTSETTTTTQKDSSGNDVTTTTTTTRNADNSSTVQKNDIVMDSEGNVVSTKETTTTNNSDGSYNSTATSYDENGDATDTVNVTGDTVGNVDTQSVSYNDQGAAVVTAYNIDTTNSNGIGRDITGDGVNTEFVPFDGSDGFELHIRFRSVKTEQPNPPVVEDTEDTGSNYHFTILCSKDPNTPYPGFHIRWTLNKNNYNSGNLIFGYRGKTGSATNRTLTLSKNNNMYDFTIAYDPKLKKYPSKFRCQDNLNGGAVITLNIDFNPLTYACTLGYNINQQGEPYRYSNVTIYDFTINKL